MTDPIVLVERVLREEDLERAVHEAAAARNAWVHEQLRRRWPLLAEVPEHTQRLLSAVQRLLASTTRLEAEQAAAYLADLTAQDRVEPAAAGSTARGGGAPEGARARIPQGGPGGGPCPRPRRGGGGRAASPAAAPSEQLALFGGAP